MPYPAAMQALIDKFTNHDEKIVQLGTFQPHDLVHVHHNPTALTLNNAYEGTVANSTVVILTDGQERVGLKFKPNTSVIADRPDQTLQLIVASSVAQTISVECENYPAKEVQIAANQPAIINIGMHYGIPFIASPASFFVPIDDAEV